MAGKCGQFSDFVAIAWAYFWGAFKYRASCESAAMLSVSFKFFSVTRAILEEWQMLRVSSNSPSLPHNDEAMMEPSRARYLKMQLFT